MFVRSRRKLPDALRASVSFMAMAAGSFGWSGLANSNGQNPSSPWLLLPDSFTTLEDGKVILSLETGEQVTLTAEQYVILDGGLLLVVDQLAQNAIAALPVIGSLRAQHFTDVQPVRALDGSIVQAGNQQPLWSGEGTAPRLFDDIDIQRFEFAQNQQDEDEDDQALILGGAGSTLVGLGITILGMMNSGATEAASGGTTSDGGSDGGGNVGPGGTQLNRAPSISSPLTASVAENTATAFYTVTAYDPDGDICTCAITGGADEDKFELDGDQLKFKVAPDFESNGSANSNNTYEVEITIDDGNGGTDTQTLTVSVTDVADSPEFLSNSGFQALTPAAARSFTGSAGNSFIGYLDASTTNPDPLVAAGAVSRVATFNMSAGGDNFFLAANSAAFSGGSLNYTGGPGDDTLSFGDNLAYTGSATFDMSAGGDNNFVAAESAALSGSLSYTGGPGNDTLSFGNSLAYSGSATFDMSSGGDNNLVAAESAAVYGSLSYTGGTGDDTLTFEGYLAYSAASAIFDMRAGGENTLTALIGAASESGSVVYYDGVGNDTLTFGDDLAISGFANFVMSNGGTNTLQAGENAAWTAGSASSPGLLYTGGSGVDHITFGDGLGYKGYVTIDLSNGGDNVLSFGERVGREGKLKVVLGTGADSLTFGNEAAVKTWNFAEVELNLGDDTSADTIVFLGSAGTNGGVFVIQNFDHADGDTIDLNDLSGFNASVTGAGAGTAVEISTNDAELRLKLGSNSAATALDAALGSTGGTIIF